MRVRVLKVVFCMITLMGCARQIYQPSPSASDPANPAAPESPISPRPNWLQTEIPARVEQPRTKPTPSTAPAIYTCPMHPEVVQSDEGRCPECGMRLVPKDQK